MSTAHEEPAAAMTPPPTARSALHAVRRALTSVFALLYLAVCAGLLVWAVVVSSLDDPDASLAGVVPILATAPVSLIVLCLPDHASMLYLAVGLGAVADALFIGGCARVLRRGPRGRSGAGPRP